MSQAFSTIIGAVFETEFLISWKVEVEEAEF